MQIVCWFSFIFLCIRFLVTLANFLTKPFLKTQNKRSSLFVSILIPTRNEEKSLPNLLKSILDQEYQNFEIIVLDDDSTDGTPTIIENFKNIDSRIKSLKGKTLPSDWLGKNWACHQLAQEAKGEYFMFLDADVTIDVGFINACLVTSSKDNCTLFSVFPHQFMKTEGEKIVVPIMHYLLLTLLPLKLILKGKQPSLAAANGQCMLFEAKKYREFNFHEKVKNVVTEDIRIMQLVKTFGLKGNTESTTGLIHCRMYNNYFEGIQGFSKNILAGFAGSIPFLLFYLFFTFFIYFLPSYWLINEIITIGTLVLVVSMKVMLSLMSGQKIAPNLIYHPFQMATIVIAGFLSIYKKYTKTNSWKGRIIPTESA